MFFTAHEVADAAGIAPNTIYQNRLKDGFPSGKFEGKRLYFTKKEKDFYCLFYSTKNTSKSQKKLFKTGQAMSQGQAAKYLGVSEALFHYFQKYNEKPIPFQKAGGRYLYLKKDLDQFKKSGRTIKNQPKTKEEKEAHYKTWKKARDRVTSDPKKDAMIKPLRVPKHKCSRPECNIMTTNKFLCDKCKAEFAGECGDNFYSPPTRRTGMRGE